MDNNTRYDTSHDAHMRLSNTVCRYKGRAIMVRNVPEGSDKIIFVYINPASPKEVGEEHKVSFNSPDLDVSSPPIGWGNPDADKWKPSYFFRNAARQQQQGLALSRLGVFNPRFEEVRRGWEWNLWEDLRFIGQMIEDDGWPSIETASQSSLGMAISLDWAIIRYRTDQHTFSLFHQDMDVGVFVPATKTFIFAIDSYTKTRQQSIEKLLMRVDNFHGGYNVETKA